jgi:hypothetical protein
MKNKLERMVMKDICKAKRSVTGDFHRILTDSSMNLSIYYPFKRSVLSNENKNESLIIGDASSDTRQADNHSSFCRAIDVWQTAVSGYSGKKYYIFINTCVNISTSLLQHFSKIFKGKHYTS